jgi:nucleotide-binding universal stress UspA family protein
MEALFGRAPWQPRCSEWVRRLLVDDPTRRGRRGQSASSRKALSYASSIAERANAELTVMHVVELMPTFEPAVVGLPDEKDHRLPGTADARERLHGALQGGWR